MSYDKIEYWKYKGIYNLIKGKAKTYKKWKIKLTN